VELVDGVLDAIASADQDMAQGLAIELGLGSRWWVMVVATLDAAKFLGELSCTQAAIKSEINGFGVGSQVKNDTSWGVRPPS
jgi:hypothetical protein